MKSSSNIVKRFSPWILPAIVLGLPGQAWAADACNKKSPTNGDLSNCLQSNPIIKDVNVIINFLSAGIGIVVVAVIILGGIQYSMAGGSPDATAKAKQRILNGLIALFVYIFIFAFLQWLVPGGIFS